MSQSCSKILQRCCSILALMFVFHESSAQEMNFSAVKAEVDFTKKLRVWDGFGFNYVQTAQTFDYEKFPQDYGGFKFLKETDKQKVVALIFGDDGLKPALVKLFLDPLHQKQEGGIYDHRTTTNSMRFFVKEGLKLTRKRGDNLTAITTLYGPPAYITKQKMLRGRDLDPAQTDNLVKYYVDWARFLVREEGIPLKYVSLHNEGESWLRWPQDGTLGETNTVGHDYNFFFPPQQATAVAKRLRVALDKAGLRSVGVTPGENTNWYRWTAWGYADAFADDPEALNSLGLITSHGFYVGGMESGRWFGPHSNVGTELLRSKKPSLHAWCTSTAWNRIRAEFDSTGKRVTAYTMDAFFIKEVHGNIYEAKLNGIIPWGGIQAASQWNKPDPNPGCAIRVYDDGTFEIQKGYYFFKQVSRAGQAGMSVVRTTAMDSEISLIGFSANGTTHKDAFVLTNIGSSARTVVVHLKGLKSQVLAGYRTTGSQTYRFRTSAVSLEDGSDNYKSLGKFDVKNGTLQYEAPPGSVTTFFAQ